MNYELEAKQAIAKRLLRSLNGKVVVAVSGGVDSAVLLALAVEALGAPSLLAVTGASEAVPPREVEEAGRAATALGVRHIVVPTREMDRPGYVANSGDRCYHCRAELFGILEDLRRREGMAAIAYGAIVDDLSDDRPGMRAAAEQGIVAPLVEAGMTKSDVRALAAHFRLGVADKPASPCLASRIPAGSPVTAVKLSQIDVAEAALKALGLRQFRVRHQGEIARIEVDPAGRELLADPEVRAEASRALRAAGFRFVTIDLEDFRSGGSRDAAIGGARADATGRGPLYSIAPARERGQ